MLVALLSHDPGFGSHTFVGFIDDGSPDLKLLDRLAAPYLGTSSALTDHRDSGFVVGVGDPAVRERWARRAVDAGLVPVTVVHRQATLGGDVVLGPGTVVCAGARITTNVRTGLHAHVNINATVAHDVVLGDYVTINPQAALSGDVHVQHRATIGSGAVVRQGLVVGEGSTTGAGAVVVRDVPPDTVVVGVPARVLTPPR